MRISCNSAQCKILALVFFVKILGVPVYGQDFKSYRLKLIAEYSHYEDVVKEYPVFKDNKPSIVIADDCVLFYGSDTIVDKKMVKVEPQFKEEDIKELNTSPRTREVSKFFDTYENIDNIALLVTKRRASYTGVNDYGRAEYINSTLFDNGGNEIISFNNYINLVKFSPDARYFVATWTGPGARDTLFFYDGNGQLIVSRKFKNPSPSFTAGGKFVKVRQAGKDEFTLYTNKGEYVYYTKLWDDHKIGILFNTFVLENNEYLLFSTCLPDNKLSLIDFNNNLIWQNEINRVLEIFYDTTHQCLMVYTIDERKDLNESSKSIHLCSPDNGRILDSISDCELIKYANNLLFLRKDSNFCVYKVY